VANTAANRRLTFGTAGGRGAGRDQFRGLPVFLLALALTSGALAALQAAVPSPSLALELAGPSCCSASSPGLRAVHGLQRGVVLPARRALPARPRPRALAGRRGAAALAGLVRPTGLVLILSCGWAAVAAIRRHGSWRPAIAPLLAPAGTLAFFAYLQMHTGDWLAYAHATQRG
jgi:hypothetical protein